HSLRPCIACCSRPRKRATLPGTSLEPLERERVAGSALHGDPAKLRELVNHRLPAEASPAGVLDAAERHLRLVADRLVVDVDDARLEQLREREAAIGVGREDPRA